MKANPKNPLLAAHSTTMKLDPANRFCSAGAGVLTTLIMIAMALPVSAANLYWEGVQTAQNTWEIWQTAANWDTLANGTGGAPITAPTTGDIAIFNTTVNNGTRGARINANRSIDGLIFNNTGTTGIASDTSTRRTLTIGSSGITMSSTAGSATLGTGSRPLNVTLGASQTWLNNNSASTLSHLAGSTATTLALGAFTLTVDGAGATTFSSDAITGSAATAIIKNGAGVLTFNSAAASFAGDVQINGGTVRYGLANALPSTTDVLFNTASGTATLDLNGQSGTIQSLTINGATGTGAAITTGAGTLTLGGNVTYNSAIGTPNGATISGKLDLGAATRTFEIRDSGVAEELLVSAVISGSGGLTKASTGQMTLNGLNTFTGDVVVREGVLSANTLGNVGASSSIGAGTTGVVQLGFGTRTGILQYTGAPTSTNRQIQLGRSTAAEVGGGVIENNGSGALTFSNADFNATLAGVTVTRNLTLQGTNTDLNTISGIIRDNDTGTGGVVTLTKEGGGTWVLAGANVYNGATNVNNGTLLINGSTANSSVVTVASGATLGGSGTVGGNTTISGIHSPGTSPGIQTFSNNLSYTTGSSVTWELVANGIGVRGTDFDGINVGATLGFTEATSLNLVFNFAGSTVNWADTFWDTSHTGTSGWLVYDGATSLTNFGNLSVTAANWFDGSGGLFNASNSGNTFSLFQDGNDIYLNYTVIPEPRAALLGGLGLFCLLRRRRA
jgi:hypothetical protein